MDWFDSLDHSFESGCCGRSTRECSCQAGAALIQEGSTGRCFQSEVSGIDCQKYSIPTLSHPNTSTSLASYHRCFVCSGLPWRTLSRRRIALRYSAASGSECPPTWRQNRHWAFQKLHHRQYLCWILGIGLPPWGNGSLSLVLHARSRSFRKTWWSGVRPRSPIATVRTRFEWWGEVRPWTLALFHAFRWGQGLALRLGSAAYVNWPGQASGCST